MTFQLLTIDCEIVESFRLFEADKIWIMENHSVCVCVGVLANKTRNIQLLTMSDGCCRVAVLFSFYLYLAFVQQFGGSISKAVHIFEKLRSLCFNQPIYLRFVRIGHLEKKNGRRGRYVLRSFPNIYCEL